MTDSKEYFRDRLLVASPFMSDERFRGAVIYICKHDKNGAMGLIVNRHTNDIRFGKLLRQFELKADEGTNEIPVFDGGPVDIRNGFILHSSEYECQGTVECGTCRLSSSSDILSDIASGRGPVRYNVTLGYAGWQPDQLENEIIKNDWIITNANPDAVFDHDIDNKWGNILRGIGISHNNMTSEIGHA